MSNRSLVTICIVTHNSAPDLEQCLASIGALDYRPLEVVLVDCASEDGSPEIAAMHHPRWIPFSILVSDDNIGFAGGMNLAIGASRGQYVLTLNADAVLRPDYIDQLLNRRAQHPEMRIGAIAGRLIRFPNGRDRILDACGMRLTMTWRHFDRGSSQPDTGQFMAPQRIFGATGAASLFVREALEDAAIDGQVFAQEFHSFREDAELCFRLRERRWEVLYEPSAKAMHRRRNLPNRRHLMPEEVNFHSLKNRYLLRAYHQTLENFLLTLLPVFWRDILILGYVVLLEPSSLRAYSWLWRRRRCIRERRRQIQSRRIVRAIEVDRWFFRRALPL